MEPSMACHYIAGAVFFWTLEARNLDTERLHPHHGPQRHSAAKHDTFLAVIQKSLRRTTARLRGEETAAEGGSSDDYQLGIAERNSPERRLFRSITSVQAIQAGVWSKSIPLEARL